MKNHPALAAWLPTARNIQICELMSVHAPDGSVWRYATGHDVWDGANLWTSSLLWARSQLTFAAGIEVSSCTVTIEPRPGDVLGNLPVAAAIRAGIWDAADFTLARAYYDSVGNLRGTLPRFAGRLGPLNMKDGSLKLTLNSHASTLNRAVPPVYQASCLNTLFDVGCGLDRAAWEVTGNAGGGSTPKLIWTGRGEAPDWFTAGVIMFTGGALLGLRRTVREHGGSGDVLLFDAFPSAPAAGDPFRITPGCNRSLGAGGCAKFNNRPAFRGQPFIPAPETAL